MDSLFSTKTQNDNCNNAYIVFNDKTKIPIDADGTKGIFYGYLVFINGLFSIQELKNNSIESQFFITDTVNIEIGDAIPNKHVVVIGDSFVNFNKKKQSLKDLNITIVKNIQAETLNNCLSNDNDYTKNNYIKCAVYFPDNFDNIEQDLKQINENLMQMEQYFYKFNAFNQYLIPFKPYFLPRNYSKNKHYFKKYEILEHLTKPVAVMDFGISNALKTILNEYFNIIFLPCTETAQHIEYLYKDKKIDGVILSDFTYNTEFISQSVKNEIKKVLNTQIPVLGVGASAILIAELYGSTTSINKNILDFETYDIEDIHHKQYKMTNFYYKRIDILSDKLRSKFYDKNVNIVGFESKENNILGYTFSFTNNNLDIAFFLNKFFKKIINVKKR